MTGRRGGFRAGIAGIGTLVMLMGTGAPIRGQAKVIGPPCHDTVFSGRVVRGQSFAASLGSGLIFLLDAGTAPENPPGWTIRVVPSGDEGHDYAMVATPPYRFWNPRYLDASYGVSAAQSLSMTPRVFSFVAAADDFETAMGALDLLLWPADHPAEEVREAKRRLEELPAYSGRLSIAGGQATPPDSLDPGGAIQWLSFDVRLCVPEGARGR